MKQQIVSRWDSTKVLFECDVPDDLPSGLRMRHALEKAVAVRPRVALSGADFSRANLSGADFSRANLSGADFSDAYLLRANFSGANLSGADFSRANLSRANLSGADLSGADLSGANLSGADLSGANLSGADLSGANLSRADLSVPKTDFFDILLRASREVAGLRAALIAGKVDGSTYEGECACLVGTIANVRSASFEDLGNGIKPNSSRPAERWFLGIKKGDTPETNQISAITVAWINEFVGLLELAKS